MQNKREVFENCSIVGDVIKIPEEKLEPSLYREVKKAMEKAGGVWKGGKTFGFVFEKDPKVILERLKQGEEINIKQEFQFFETPPQLAEEMVSLADISPFDTILEPSAGRGAIIKELNLVTPIYPRCYELMEENRDYLRKSTLRFDLIGEDFMNHPEHIKYDRIIANPPFSKNQDIIHLRKMYECLGHKGKLVCVTSQHWLYGREKVCQDFRSWLEMVACTKIPLEKGTFKESGTNVESMLIIIDK